MQVYVNHTLYVPHTSGLVSGAVRTSLTAVTYSDSTAFTEAFLRALLEIMFDLVHRGLSLCDTYKRMSFFTLSHSALPMTEVQK